MNLFDYAFGTPDAVAQGDALDAQLRSINDKAYAPGGAAYKHAQDLLGTSAAQDNIAKVLADEASGSTEQLIKTGDANYDATHGSPAADWGKVVKDFLLLVVIGGGVWLFVKVGGLGWLKKILS